MCWFVGVVVSVLVVVGVAMVVVVVFVVCLTGGRACLLVVIVVTFIVLVTGTTMECCYGCCTLFSPFFVARVGVIGEVLSPCCCNLLCLVLLVL